MLKNKSFTRLPIWPALMSAIVAPGAGQILNREFKKGIFLFAVFIGSFSWFFKVISEQLSLLTTIKPEVWQKDPSIVQEYLLKIVNQNPSMFFSFQLLVILIWGFSVIDAYITAKHQNKTPPPVLSDETTHPLS